MKRYVAILASVLILASCTAPTPTPVAIAPTQAPTQTPLPTNTPAPTSTATSTLTPVPPTATATATASPSATPTSTATPTSVPTTKLTSAPTSAPPVALPPAGMVYPAPKLVGPADGIHLKMKTDRDMTSITFEWLSVGTLENGKIRCSWKEQPNGTEAAIFDRYIVKFDPPLPKDWRLSPYIPPIDSFTDGGTKITVVLAQFQPDTTYTWKVAVGRWCATITPGPTRESFVNLISPYTESRTFRYSP